MSEGPCRGCEFGDGDSGFRCGGLGFEVWGFEVTHGAQDVVERVAGLHAGLGVGVGWLNFGVWVLGFEFDVMCFGLWVLGVGFRVWGLGFRIHV